MTSRLTRYYSQLFKDITEHYLKTENMMNQERMHDHCQGYSLEDTPDPLLENDPQIDSPRDMQKDIA